MANRKIRIYTFVNGPDGISNQSKYYSVCGKQMWHVAAVSIKQAYYLAGNEIWRKNGAGTGIVEFTESASDAKWQFDDGGEDWYPRFKHGAKLDG